MSATLPPVAVSCGDPAGIGPEIAQMAWAKIGRSIPFFVVGPAEPFRRFGQVQDIDRPADAQGATALPVLSRGFALGDVVPGTPNASHAGVVKAAIESAVDLANTGAASAVCTLPISKSVLKAGTDFAFPGHTEFLAHLGGNCDVAMMIAAPQLRVVPVTIHIPLSEVAKSLTAEAVETTIRTTHTALTRDFGLDQPRIAVAGLNPHAGESGTMGTEEIRWLTPLLDWLRQDGFVIQGPLPADTMFHDRARATYDAAIAMYHDQALIPVKTLAFDEGVNVTLGLPFVRTSPDHGTAFDIAGKGIARPDSFIAALKMAHDVATSRAATR